MSSDSREIIKRAYEIGAIGIHRGEDLCGDVPDIPVYQHALSKMGDVDAIVAVHVDTPLVEPNTIAVVKRLMEMGVQEVMTCKPIEGATNYKDQYSHIYGSIRGISKERLENYGDPYKPSPDVWVVDSSPEIETPEDYKKVCK